MRVIRLLKVIRFVEIQMTWVNPAVCEVLAASRATLSNIFKAHNGGLLYANNYTDVSVIILARISV